LSFIRFIGIVAARTPSAEALEAGAMSGAFFETWVVTEIYKSYINAGKRPPLYYYRDSNQKEIDLIIQKGSTLHPIEIKKSAAPAKPARQFSVLEPITREPENNSRDDTSHLKMEIGIGAVICLSSDVMPLDRKNWLVPAWVI
jgi:predicted AAA+ superfamily ATPase